MALPGMGPRRDPEITARVKQWVIEELGDADGTILVTELACSEPGCPPVETVIALLTEGEQRQRKIHKPLAEVDRSDVKAALAPR